MSDTVEIPEVDSLNDEEFMNKFGSIESLEDNPTEVMNEEEEAESSNEDESQESKTQAEETTETKEQDDATVPTEANEEEQSESDNTSDDNVNDVPEVTQEDQLQAIYAPFKANGTEISVSSPEEAIRLMQQGAGSAKRMQELAPKLKIIQMLENNELLNEDSINQLIAVGSKDPKAIAAFLKEADIDPFTLEMDQEDYQPKDHRISDQEYKLKQTINELADQPKFQETLDTADSWDDKSKEMALNDPLILTHLNQHLQSGVYQQVSDMVRSEIVKGNISSDVPFLEAYRYVGNQLEQAGVFAGQDEQTSNKSNATPNKGNEKLNSRRKAASPTKSISSNSTKDEPKKDVDLFKMSDEDFLKEYSNAEWMNPM